MRRLFSLALALAVVTGIGCGNDINKDYKPVGTDAQRPQSAGGAKPAGKQPAGPAVGAPKPID